MNNTRYGAASSAALVRGDALPCATVDGLPTEWQGGLQLLRADTRSYVFIDELN